VVEQGNRAEKFLRKCGYYESGPRGKLFRRTGNIAESDDEALEILKRMKTAAERLEKPEHRLGELARQI